MLVLLGLKAASKRLEVDNYVTGSKALKVFKRLWGYLTHVRNGECRGPGSAIIPLAGDFVHKLDEALNDPQWFWQMAFLTLMDPSGECIDGSWQTCF